MPAEKVAIPQSPFVVGLTENHLEDPSYNPAKLLDTMLERLKLKNDAALSRVLLLPPPVLSKIRNKHTSITSAIVLRMHDITGWSIADMRSLMGVKPAVKPL